MTLNAALATPDGRIGVYLSGAGDTPLPGIVLLHEIFGVNGAMQLAADTFASAGYAVAIPDLYHRIAPGTALSYQPADRPRALELWARFDDAAATTDTVAVQAWLRKHPACDGRVALIGFCLGGKLAILSAARQAADCAISFYPVQLETHLAEIERVICPIQVHIGENDAHIPASTREIVREAVCARAENEFYIHPGAEHGFYNSVRPAGYHPLAAREAHRATLRFLRRWLIDGPTESDAGFAPATAAKSKDLKTG
ncbi:MAG: dienelactone hydrolase family protein [Rhodospirillales bacterium]|nr:dienelactone hydrolase family protein [Rhodospirillales bacterium]